MMTLKQFVQTPAPTADRWELVVATGYREDQNARVRVKSFNYNRQQALAALETYRIAYEQRGWKFIRSDYEPDTYEGLKPGCRVMSLYIRPYLPHELAVN